MVFENVLTGQIGRYGVMGSGLIKGRVGGFSCGPGVISGVTSFDYY